ncbi:MAG: glycoside hydrolase family 15 protein [Elusimicrobia bacterium]|nr:glycoside hydrolase family 15 protein [Elusimicrobiota bacterium]
MADRRAAERRLSPERRETIDIEPAAPESTPPLIPYPALRDHGLIGDRRTCALVAADGTLDWMCIPHLDGELLFGALLDAGTGGFWRIGPAALSNGRQSYVENSAALVTSWSGDGWELDLTDCFAWPEEERPGRLGSSRAVLRRLRCSRGSALCASSIAFNPRIGGGRPSASFGGWTEKTPVASVRMWSNRPHLLEPGGQLFTLSEGEALWMVLDVGESGLTWTTELAQETLVTAAGHWQSWARRLGYSGPRSDRMLRSAMTLRLLTSISGATVSAPTSSLPRRWGGSASEEGRVTRLADVSSAICAMSLAGDLDGAGGQLDALSSAIVGGKFPGVLGAHGERAIRTETPTDFFGYRGTLPVRFGASFAPASRAAIGLFADAVHSYARAGGRLGESHMAALAQAAEAATNWREPDAGLWHGAPERHYVASVALSWVALDRALKNFGRKMDAKTTRRWRSEKDGALRAILRDGWSERLQSFRGVMGEDTLDASALLIAVMDVLPGDDARLSCTVDRITEQLSMDGFPFRFRPRASGRFSRPIGEYEAASTVASLWAVNARAKTGRPELAEQILEQIELAAPLGLFSEHIDPRGRALLGNVPYSMAQAEYIRAVYALASVRPVDKLKLLLGEAERKLLRRADPAWEPR